MRTVSDGTSKFETEVDKLYDIEIDEIFLEDDLEDNDIEEAERRSDEDDDDEDDDDEEVEESTGDYNREFSLVHPQLYMDEREKRLELEYSRKDNEGEPKRFDELRERVFEDDGFDLKPITLPDEEKVEYRDVIVLAYSDVMKPAGGMEPPQTGTDLLTLEYETPEMINGQKTYQRIVFEADIDGESVYELTMRKLWESGVEVSASYDHEFDSTIFTSLNRKKEGTDGNFNEFYLNGEIGGNAVDKELLKKGDLIEWRYAEESDGTCGGVPDYHAIKNMLHQYSGMGNPYGTFQNSPQHYFPLAA